MLDNPRPPSFKVESNSELVQRLLLSPVVIGYVLKTVYFVDAMTRMRLTLVQIMTTGRSDICSYST